MPLTPAQIQQKFCQLEAELAACIEPRDINAVELKIIELQETCLHEKPYRHDHKDKEGKCIGHYCECCGKGWSTIVP